MMGKYSMGKVPYAWGYYGVEMQMPVGGIHKVQSIPARVDLGNPVVGLKTEDVYCGNRAG